MPPPVFPSAAGGPPDASAVPGAEVMPGGNAVVRWPQLALLLPLLPLLLLLASLLTPRQRQLLILDDAVPVISRPFRLEAGWLGSPRLDLQPELPPNSAMGLAVDLLDAAGRPVLQLSKAGWRERGTWQEDGESGTYDEQDADLVLALRPPVSGDYRLRLVREELEGATGAEVPGPLRVWLGVRNHSVDRGLLLITAFSSALLARILWSAVYGDCRLRRRVRGDEASLALREVLGGAGLLRVVVHARYEEPDHPPLSRRNPPAEVPLELRLTDDRGRVLLQENRTVRLQKWSGEDDSWWTLTSRWHLHLAEPGSVRVRTALPAELAGGGLELEWIDLLVEDGVVTPWLVPATALAAAGLPAGAGS
ncbi:hypothetical protein [Cyanobium sp. NIES-981]|uniref:hypothetical protein n=1 Tax=Cyanobium sp. NIES-981 TaxID=1851505 RepID=UPI0007DD6179|nr:hypothetical protein [Cyanobium sp. NIES-981]SBO42051.1 conserved protein of unknown function [Cyanobium sp. NIES-981]